MSETPIADLLVVMFASEMTNDQILRTVRILETSNYRVPKLSAGDRRREWDRARRAKLPADWTAITQAVFERDGYACTYCGDEPGDLHCDHVIPLSRGGSSQMSNLTTACASCNLDKGSKLLSEWHFYQEYVLGVTGAA
jgi:5-methylcytosine-specific restriction endonuclease McrA